MKKVIMRMKQKGLTLIEVIISIALLGIIAVFLLPVFTAGFNSIAVSGNKSKTIYQDQDMTETNLMDGALISSDSLTIKFPGIPEISFTVGGEQGTNGSIQFFIPN